MKLNKYIQNDFFKLSALIIAIFYWFLDSSIHYFLYGEWEFEVIPSDFNELWMRTAIFVLISGYGFFVDYSFRKMRKLQEEQRKTQDELENALTKILNGFMPICSVCKKIRISDSDVHDRKNWTEIDRFITDRTDLQLSHSYCPDCADKVRAEIK